MSARFFITPNQFPAVPPSTLQVEGDIFRHMMVLRLRIDNEVLLFNGKGDEAQGVIVDIGKRHAIIQVNTLITRNVESSFATCLLISLIANDKMDFAIQKAVELGVSQINPVLAKYSQALPKAAWHTRHKHWQKIIISACEQCGRTKLPELMPMLPLATLINEIDEADEKHCRIYAAFDGVSAKKLFDNQHNKFAAATLAIGPEGGFDDSEIQQLVQAGFIGLNLGPRILRTETAAIKALSLLQCLLGDG